MQTSIFILVAAAFIAVLMHKRSLESKGAGSGTVLTLPSPAAESDEYIYILAFNPKEHDNAHDFGKKVEKELDKELGELLLKECRIRVEFITVGLCLVAVIRVSPMSGKKKRGMGSIWKRQSAETIFRR